MKVSTKAFVVASALSIALSVQAAPAASQVAVRQKVVSYDDLHLQDQAGARQLLMRLVSAAKYVCSSSSLGERVIKRRSMPMETCRTEALGNAVADVNHPVVTAMYESKHRVFVTRLANRQ